MMTIMSRGDASDLQQHGQKLYKQGDFRAAVEAFTEASIKRNADVIGILDNRAAAYSKLTQYDLALRDAKQMIKKDKMDDRGYLRCGKILQLGGKPEKAVEVYAYALKTLSSDNPRRRLLQQMHDRLKDRFSKCQDPFTALPLEIATMILASFSFKQIVGILRVSKGWKQFLSSMTSKWLEIDFTTARGRVGWTSVRSYINYSKAMVTHAVIANISAQSLLKTLEMLSRCPKLEHLELKQACDPQILYNNFRRAKQIKSLVVSAETAVSRAHIVKILRDLPLLERIAFHRTRPSIKEPWPLRLPNLKSVTLVSHGPEPEARFASGIEIPALLELQDVIPGESCHTIPNLVELNLAWHSAFSQDEYQLSVDLGRFTRLRRLDFYGMTCDGSLIFPPSIEFIRLDLCRFRFALGNNTGKFPPLANLRTLILREVPHFCCVSLADFINCTQATLHTLHVDRCSHFFVDVFLAYMRDQNQLQEVTELNISGMTGVSDKIAEDILALAPKLKVLHVSHTLITGCFIKTLADARTSLDGATAKLDRLIIKGCEEVSPDAVTYGRAKGMEIIR